LSALAVLLTLIGWAVPPVVEAAAIWDMVWTVGKCAVDAAGGILTRMLVLDVAAAVMSGRIGVCSESG
jgi:hypothetical protein